jgi:hypothetical protein
MCLRSTEPPLLPNACYQKPFLRVCCSEVGYDVVGVQYAGAVGLLALFVFAWRWIVAVGEKQNVLASGAGDCVAHILVIPCCFFI